MEKGQIGDSGFNFVEPFGVRTSDFEYVLTALLYLCICSVE